MKFLGFSCDKHKILKTLGLFPVLLTLALLGWSVCIYFALVGSVLTKDFGRFWAVLLGSLIAMAWVLSVWSYMVCVVRNPGNPSGYVPTSTSMNDDVANRRYADQQSRSSHSEDSDSDYDEEPLTEEQVRQSELLYSITVRNNGQPRFCRKCNGPKPDRSHHCSVCGVCVLKMDHHCPWLNNCVGFCTQKAFLLFLGYTAIYCTIICYATAYCLYLDMMSVEDFSINVLLLAILSAAFSLSLWGFGGYHIYLLLTNTTTIESYEKNKYRVASSSSSSAMSSRENGRVRRQATIPKNVNLFDLGKKKNFYQVFGTHWHGWFLPTYTTAGDGVRFPISFEGYNELRQNID